MPHVLFALWISRWVWLRHIFMIFEKRQIFWITQDGSSRIWHCHSSNLHTPMPFLPVSHKSLPGHYLAVTLWLKSQNPRDIIAQLTMLLLLNTDDNNPQLWQFGALLLLRCIQWLCRQEKVGWWSVESPNLVMWTKDRYFVKCPQLSTPGNKWSKLGKIWST